jgi:hypothetical protein
MPCQLPGNFQLTRDLLKHASHFVSNGISYGYFGLDDAHLITPTDALPFDTSEDHTLHSHHHPLYYDDGSRAMVMGYVGHNIP